MVCGIDEREENTSRTTLYNTVVIIGPDGNLLNRHRKIMPTNAERMVWGFGDAVGLKVVETPSGRLGTLICWENYMPQARLSSCNNQAMEPVLFEQRSNFPLFQYDQRFE